MTRRSSVVVDALFRMVGGAVVLSCAIGASGCVIGGPVSPESIATDAATLAESAAFCVDEVNRLRATAGGSPLTRSGRIDAFSAEAAHVDGEAHEAHTYFRMTNGGNGTVKAENVIAWWKAAQYGSVRTVIRRGLATMWAQGPGGTHYEIMKGNYTEMGCGVFVANGEVTVSQDYR